MFSKTMFRKTVYGTTFKDVQFCPSAVRHILRPMRTDQHQQQALLPGLRQPRSLLGLSRVLGGSLRNQQTAHLITDSELDSLVRDLLRTVPIPR